jgi:hypothetical protein
MTCASSSRDMVVVNGEEVVRIDRRKMRTTAAMADEGIEETVRNEAQPGASRKVPALPCPTTKCRVSA